MDTLERHLWTRIDRLGDQLDRGLLVDKFKAERRVKGVIQVSGSGNLGNGGAIDCKWGAKEKNRVRDGFQSIPLI